eukprot:m.216958 g.216958  ORF g.216958 m.216958 type:complete len:199 (-) comp18663_c2_seq4:39-635(-)
MGYTTDFLGAFRIEPPLCREQAEYILKFSGTRRMRRDEEKAAALPDPTREAVQLPIGVDGGYFVGGGGFAGQDRDASITDYNMPSPGQPGLWCQWVPSADGSFLVWNGAEKFYFYDAWLHYLIDHFLKPWQRTLTGTIFWQGEESSDQGLIKLDNNNFTISEGEGEGVTPDAATHKTAQPARGDDPFANLPSLSMPPK